MIPHNKPTLGPEETQAVARVIASGRLAQGPEVEAFENEFCELMELPHGHGVALSSGTAALFMGLRVLSAPGKLVGLPVYACSALRNAVAMAGGRELVLDVKAGTPNLDIEQLLGSSGAPLPDILIAPHMFGLPMDLSRVGAKQVIEDCAQSLGARVNGTPAGLQAAIGVFSFYASKLMTTGGQGGMLVSRDKHLVDEIRDFREFDCRRDHKLRFNFQMTELQAAIGRVQLRKLPQLLARRSRLFRIYRDAGLNLLDLPDGAGVQPVRFRAVVRTAAPQDLIEALRGHGARAIVPVEDWELLGDGNAFPNALELARSTVSLPLFPALEDDDAQTIAACVQGLP